MDEIHLRTTVVDDGGKQRRVRLYGEASPFTGSTEKIPAEIAYCKRIAETLERHYPGHPWAVEVNIEQGYAKFSIPVLLGPNWGMIIILDELTDHKVVQLGGELLERFKLPRNTIDVAGYLQLMKDTPMLGLYRAKHRAIIPH